MSTGRNLNNRGFSLVELLIVVVMLSTVILAMSSLYESTQRTAASSDEVVEVQQNLRIAMDTIARDIRMAGFMEPDEPFANTPQTPTEDGDNDCADGGDDCLIIRTASDTGRVVRIDLDFTSPSGTTDEANITVASAGMAQLFDDDDYVRIIRPPDHSQPKDRIFRVKGTPTGTTVKLVNFDEAKQYKKGDVIVRTGNGAPHPNTVAYFLSGTEIKRKATADAAQVVANKITGLQFSYLLDDGTETGTPADPEAIRAVRITLTGQTVAAMGGKQRQLTNVVTLRNR